MQCNAFAGTKIQEGSYETFCISFVSTPFCMFFEEKHAPSPELIARKKMEEPKISPHLKGGDRNGIN